MIRICTENPLVIDAEGNDTIVRGPAALLLRVLLLSPDPKVPVPAAVEAMGIEKTGFGTYCEQLRTAFGDKMLVDRTNGYVTYTGDRSATDAAIIRAKYNEILSELDLLDDSGRPLPNPEDDVDLELDLAKKILPLLEEIEELYGGTPAIGLDRDWVDYPTDLQRWAQPLTDIASEWLNLWTSVILLAADCRMLIHPSKKTGIRLVADLLKPARDPDPVAEVWPRLLRAAEMSQNYRDRTRAWQLTNEYYERVGEAMPPELSVFMPPPRPVPNTPTTPHRARQLASPLEPAQDGIDHLHEIAEALGITTASTLRLRGEVMDPMQCIERTQNRLYFSGVLASKWVIDPGVRSAFDEMLTKLDALPERERDVRFLIIDPDGDAYSLLYQMRGGRLSSDSVPHLKELTRRHPSLQVKVIDALPAFRIVVIDDDMVSFSPYALEEERYATSRLGWEAPHVMLDPHAQYPLAEAFKLYFEERWNNARPI
ncbi:hypothetical protein HBA53_24555 (plasmid) [Rhodococcus pyridinivorans]|uniref:hypothetical protein n=1 Tax=Rhodococcus pyridinivorans TaxID=103816 RepID=UPI001C3011F6|nr:hypothetical protein [Rhodococcus pyridinivorans]QXF84284.1 hypothetical protein HBA53_24555 [Rhodococcus pyridinivorans]